jgi:adenylate kinase
MSIIKNLFDYVTSLGKTVVVRVPQQVYVKMTGFTHFTFEIDHRDVYDYQRDEKLTINDLKQRWLIDEKIKSIGL